MAGVPLGVDADKIAVVGNGVDTAKFKRLDRRAARDKLGLAGDGPVLISVGALVERKGFHRVLECLPQLRKRFPNLRYLIVGGPGPEGDYGAELRRAVDELGLKDCVTFLGAIAQDALNVPLSAADVFVLATSNEGWANVFLEAMACGLPVVIADVGGNAEVVADPRQGIVVPFGDSARLIEAIGEALERDWDRAAIVAHAEANSWDRRVRMLLDELTMVSARSVRSEGRTGGSAARPLLRS